MPIFMPIVLAVAVTITIIGLLLTFKALLGHERKVYYFEQGGRRTSQSMRKRRFTTTSRRQPQFGKTLWTLNNVGDIFRTRANESTSWVGITLILACLFIFALFSLRTVLLNPVLIPFMALSDPMALSTPKPSSSAPSGLLNASGAIVRLDHADVHQYSSLQEFSTWAESACSAIAMTEVINAYGHHYRIMDILQVEGRLGEITPSQGLVEPLGIDRTVAQFGFKTRWLIKPTLDDLINIANQGTPVIVNFPPSKWVGGHILVVRGGNSNYVYMVDSSSLNLQRLTHSGFLNLWEGFAVVVTPK